MSDAKKKGPVRLVPASEEARIKRALLSWLNGWPGKPVDKIDYEALPPDGTGMALISASERGAYVEKSWIGGGYRGVYDFLMVYRIQPGDSVDARLKADETLDALGEWMSAGPWPELRDDVRIRRMACISRSAVTGADRENGIEDHVIMMRLTYEKEARDPWRT